jgi:hypothetical protein
VSPHGERMAKGFERRSHWSMKWEALSARLMSQSSMKERDLASSAATALA